MTLPVARMVSGDELARLERDDAVVLGVWAVVALGSLAAFDVVPAAAAGVLLAAVTTVGAVGVLLYLQRPRPAAAVPLFSPRLLLTLSAYHVLVLLVVMGGAAVLLGGKPALLGTVAGLIGAAPAAGVTLPVWRRVLARRSADRANRWA